MKNTLNTTDMHNDFSKIIGAHELVTGQFCYEVCPWGDNLAITEEEPYTDPNDFNEGYTIVNSVSFNTPGNTTLVSKEQCNTICYPTTTSYYLRHDGLIVEKATQIQTDKGSSIKNITINDLNHMEMAGHPEIKALFEKIFYQQEVEGGRRSEDYDAVFNLGVNPNK